MPLPTPLNHIFRLFFPPVCAACGSALKGDDNGPVCMRCRWEIPLTRFWERPQNPVAERLGAMVPLRAACAFFYYADGSPFRDLVHRFKYRGGWKVARQMGLWFGRELAEAEPYRSADLIVPVPLHPRKQLARGYNQSEYLARGISEATGIPVAATAVTRVRNNKSQARSSRGERWDNVEGIFAVRRENMLAGKHILVVDDVLTTGATIISCCEAILKAVPDCTLSIATLAVSRSGLHAADGPAPGGVKDQ